MKYMNLKTTGVPVVTPRPAKKKTGKFIVLGVSIVMVAVVMGFFGDKVMAVFNPISVVASISPVDLKATDGRINVLLLGSDKRSVGPVASVLTDTILVASIGKIDKNIVLISVPRDLWVDGYQDKINAAYSIGGIEGTKEAVSNFLDIPIHYYLIVNFDLFKNVINVLGGVDVDIERDFEDTRYPVEGKEDAPLEERYEHISFKAGMQTLDGDTALKYVRSRHGNNGEGTDFARSKRQQKVIMAIKEKFLSIETLVNPVKLKDLYTQYAQNVETDIDFGTIQQFYLLSQQIDFEGLRTIVLDDRSTANEGGLLYSPVDTSLYRGAYVLIPRTGNFSQVHAYVQKYLFGN
ncbi:MAG: LCP family protein [Patescibacteria group bacterium]|jgi:LCP family protein required for cell wall assembly